MIGEVEEEYVSAIVEDLEEYFCPGVFVDVVFLFGIFVEMDFCGRIIFRLCRFVSHINDLIAQKFASSSNLQLIHS